MTSHYTRGSVTTPHGFGGVLGRPLDTFFRALTISCHNSWLVCEVALEAKKVSYVLANGNPFDNQKAN